MNSPTLTRLAILGLLLGCVLGIAGSAATSNSFRNLAWAVDSAGLMMAGILLSIFYFRKALDLVAGGFALFSLAQAMVFLSCATALDNNIPGFAAGSFMWAVSIGFISTQNVFPLFVRITGCIAALLFGIAAVQLFTGQLLNPLSQPLPFIAYPFYAATLLGWAFTIWKTRN